MLDISNTSIILFLLILILISFGILEKYLHLKSLKTIPHRIHVNGTRGKSSVTRLIAAGLRESGLKTFAKTTGTIPRIIDEKGKDVELYRLRSASIGEQIKLVRYFSKRNPDVIVMECMAVNPQYQWISEHKIVNSTLGVITNIRPDHLDEMGTTEQEIALSLSNTIPFNSKIITSEEKHFNLLNDVAMKRSSNAIKSKKEDINKEYMEKFPYIEHPENISLALKVCESIGVDREVALNGMMKTNPDPGALFIWNLAYESKKMKFVSGFAANDPSSTNVVWNLVRNKFNKMKSCIFLNTRDDRIYRTIQLVELIFNNINPDFVIIRGDNIDAHLEKLDVKKIKIKNFPMKAKPSDIVQEILKLNGYFVLGIGNMVGWGEEFISKIKEYEL